jgi:hypothetical protein
LIVFGQGYICPLSKIIKPNEELNMIDFVFIAAKTWFITNSTQNIKLFDIWLTFKLQV